MAWSENRETWRKRILIRISNIFIRVESFELIVERILEKMEHECCEGTDGVDEDSAKGILWKRLIDMKLKIDSEGKGNDGR